MKNATAQSQEQWLKNEIKKNGFNEEPKNRVVGLINDSFTRSLGGLGSDEHELAMDMWSNSSWENFEGFVVCYDETGRLTSYNLRDTSDKRTADLYCLKREARANTILGAMFECSKAGAQSYDGEHLVHWIGQQERAREMSVYVKLEQVLESLSYFVNNGAWMEASHIAGMKNFHQEASLHAEKEAIKKKSLEEKADWYIRSAGYAARAQHLVRAHKLIDRSVEAHVAAGDFLNAGYVMYETRERRIYENLDNAFLRAYHATPEFVQKLPLPERNSRKYSASTIMPREMLKKAVALFEEGARNPPVKLPRFYTREEYVQDCLRNATYWKRSKN